MMIEAMTPGQMECIQIIARQIVDGEMLILDRDSDYFRRYQRMLRALKSDRMSVARKKRLLLMKRTFVPRLLRSTYIRQAIRNEIRYSEE
jgi:hypothetical protein